MGTPSEPTFELAGDYGSPRTGRSSGKVFRSIFKGLWSVVKAIFKIVWVIVKVTLKFIWSYGELSKSPSRFWHFIKHCGKD